MKKTHKNPILKNKPLPVDIVLHPSWWHHHEGIIFDEDFFFNPNKRIEKESCNPFLTGVCCINMDHQVSDKKISAIFETVETLRKEYQKERKEYT